jgi:hypothetical protein
MGFEHQQLWRRETSTNIHGRHFMQTEKGKGKK